MRRVVLTCILFSLLLTRCQEDSDSALSGTYECDCLWKTYTSQGVHDTTTAVFFHSRITYLGDMFITYSQPEFTRDMELVNISNEVVFEYTKLLNDLFNSSFDTIDDTLNVTVNTSTKTLEVSYRGWQESNGLLILEQTLECSGMKLDHL